MSYVGIDYGLGQSNVDKENGIRYGVISQHSVGQAWYNDARPDYGDATCPKCGNKALEYDADKDGDEWTSSSGCSDYMCESCQYVFDSYEAFGDEPQGWNYSDDEYELTDCLDSDIFVLKSPFYTFAQFCSPCVPGAGNLDSPMDDGAKTYCLGHDWFQDGAPYPVYRVDTGELVKYDNE